MTDLTSATIAKEGFLPKESISYQNFVNAIRSPATKAVYINSLKRYMNHLKIAKMDDLLLYASNPKMIESQIIDYIMSLRQDGVSYATMKYLVAPIFTFYQLNDVVLINRKKVLRYLGEFKKVVKDSPYTTEQIQQALQNADQRMRMIILILASSGCRIGAIPGLTLGNLTKIPDYGLYKIVFYEGTNNEYYSFVTRECAQTGIDSYLLYRQRCREKLSFNENLNRWEPSNTPLIRLQFDINDILQVRNPQPMKVQGLRIALHNHLIRSGLRQVEHPVEPSVSSVSRSERTTNKNRVRKSVALSNGFRKHVISTFIEAGLNHEIRELIVDHATGLDSSYFRPSEKQVLEEYLKAEPLLTIDPAMRLQHENTALKQRERTTDKMLIEMQKKFDMIEKQLGMK